VTDPKGQVTTYTYHLDDTMQQVVYTNAPVATPSVSYTYDPVYGRVTTMGDGTGTTSYTYHPAGSLGAGQVALRRRSGPPRAVVEGWPRWTAR
jgi:hypothetical protein